MNYRTPCCDILNRSIPLSLQTPIDIASILSPPQEEPHRGFLTLPLHHPNPPIPNSPGPPPELRNLFNAIDSATPDRLRTILKKLSTQLPSALPVLQGELLLKPGTLKRALPRGRNDGAGRVGAVVELDGLDEGEAAERQRWEICAQCKAEYDILANGKGSCRWHSGIFVPCTSYLPTYTSHTCMVFAFYSRFSRRISGARLRWRFLDLS